MPTLSVVIPVYNECGTVEQIVEAVRASPVRDLEIIVVDVPHFEVGHQETPSPFTPLGTKGVGESGVTGPLGGLCSAIEDALPHLDLRITELPLTPDAVWKAIQGAQEVRG